MTNTILVNKISPHANACPTQFFYAIAVVIVFTVISFKFLVDKTW